jgi:hypothetical protein
MHWLIGGGESSTCARLAVRSGMALTSDSPSSAAETPRLHVASSRVKKLRRKWKAMAGESRPGAQMFRRRRNTEAERCNAMLQGEGHRSKAHVLQLSPRSRNLWGCRGLRPTKTTAPKIDVTRQPRTCIHCDKYIRLHFSFTSVKRCHHGPHGSPKGALRLLRHTAFSSPLQPP